MLIVSNGRYGCFRKWWYPQIIHFNRGFPSFSPSILGGFPPIFGSTSKNCAVHHPSSLMAREIEALVTSATKPCFTKPMTPCTSPAVSLAVFGGGGRNVPFLFWNPWWKSRIRASDFKQKIQRSKKMISMFKIGGGSSSWLKHLNKNHFQAQSFHDRSINEYSSPPYSDGQYLGDVLSNSCWKNSAKFPAVGTSKKPFRASAAPVPGLDIPQLKMWRTRGLVRKI